MKTKTGKREIMVLKNHYSAMSEEDRVIFRDAYTTKAKMPQATFYQKLNSDKFRLLEQKLFEEKLKEYYENKKRILIIGRQGTGKTVLANMISDITYLPVIDEISSMKHLKKENGIYVSHTINLNDITDLTNIHIINLDYAK